VGRFWRSFFAGFVVGVTHEDVVPLFLVILPLQTRKKAFDLVVFGGAQGEVFLVVGLRFPMTECVSVEFL
jgi:hypothetical protein